MITYEIKLSIDISQDIRRYGKSFWSDGDNRAMVIYPITDYFNKVYNYTSIEQGEHIDKVATSNVISYRIRKVRNNNRYMVTVRMEVCENYINDIGCIKSASNLNDLLSSLENDIPEYFTYSIYRITKKRK